MVLSKVSNGVKIDFFEWWHINKSHIYMFLREEELSERFIFKLNEFLLHIEKHLL